MVVDIRALQRPEWYTIRMELHDGRPYFLVHSSLVVWHVADVVAKDEPAFSRFCATFDNWPSFFRGCETVEYLGQSVPFHPPSLVPGCLRVARIHDMKLWCGNWVVVLRIETLIDSMELAGTPDISREVNQWLISRYLACGPRDLAPLH